MRDMSILMKKSLILDQRADSFSGSDLDRRFFTSSALLIACVMFFYLS